MQGTAPHACHVLASQVSQGMKGLLGQAWVEAKTGGAGHQAKTKGENVTYL